MLVLFDVFLVFAIDELNPSTIGLEEIFEMYLLVQQCMLQVFVDCEANSASMVQIGCTFTPTVAIFLIIFR